MDCTNSKFTVNCESNPALYKECVVQWMEGWSRDSMVKVTLVNRNRKHFKYVIQLSPFYDATLPVIKRWPYMRVVSLEEDN